MTKSTKWIPDPTIAEDLGVCLRTLSRWDTYEELEFPKPIVVKGRKYRDADQYEKWKRKRAVLSARERNASARERA